MAHHEPNLYTHICIYKKCVCICVLRVSGGIMMHVEVNHTSQQMNWVRAVLAHQPTIGLNLIHPHAERLYYAAPLSTTSQWLHKRVTLLHTLFFNFRLDASTTLKDPSCFNYFAATSIKATVAISSWHLLDGSLQLQCEGLRNTLNGFQGLCSLTASTASLFEGLRKLLIGILVPGYRLEAPTAEA